MKRHLSEGMQTTPASGRTGKTAAQERGVGAGKDVKLILLHDENSAERDRDIEGRNTDIVLEIKAGPDLEKGADIFAMHVINPENTGQRLEMIWHRRGGAAEVIAIVGKADVDVEVPREQKAVAVFELDLDEILFPETAAVVQVALKNVTLLELEDVERDFFGRFLGGRDGCLVVRPPCPAFRPGARRKAPQEARRQSEFFIKGGLS